MNNNHLSIIDLFAGVGGFSLGAARAGFNPLLAVENNAEALTFHKKNFPFVQHANQDISLLTSKDLLSLVSADKGEIKGIIGGPPCQGFSSIGNRVNDDPRNDLFIKFFELVKGCEPEFFVAENVPGILDEKYERIRNKALSYVQKHYTISSPIKLKASDFGAPTFRERVFFIGYRSKRVKAITEKDFDYKKTQIPVTVGEALKGLPVNILNTWLTEEDSWQVVEAMPQSVYSYQTEGHIPSSIGDPIAIEKLHNDKLVSGCFATRHSPTVEQRYQNLKQGEKDPISKSVRLKLDGLCPTLRAGTGPDKGSFQAVRPIHPTESRVITPREAARLQGFPDWFQFSPTKWHSFRQIGNSVSPILAESIFQVIYDQYY